MRNPFMSKIYLEISGRGMGKTHRLIKAVVEHIKNGGTAYVHAMTLRGTKAICDKVTAQLPQEQVERLFSSKTKKNIPIGARGFWDDVDFIENNSQIEIREGDYYATTPCRVRSFDDLIDVKTKDILVRLVRFNEGLWTAGTPICGGLIDNGFIKDIKLFRKETIESEILAIWLKR